MPKKRATTTAAGSFKRGARVDIYYVETEEGAWYAGRVKSKSSDLRMRGKYHHLWFCALVLSGRHCSAISGGTSPQSASMLTSAAIRGSDTPLLLLPLLVCW